MFDVKPAPVKTPSGKHKGGQPGHPKRARPDLPPDSVVRRGLLAIIPERERAVELILDRARQLDFEDAICWWAVLPEEEAADIARRLDGGELVSALYALNQRATDLGRILPSDRGQWKSGQRFSTRSDTAR